MGGENLQDDYLAVNPRGVLPTLVLNNGAIIDEAAVESWIRQTEADALIPAADVLRNTNPDFENRSVPGTSDTPQLPALAERGIQRIQVFYARLDKHLKKSAYIAHNCFTAADITAMCAIDFTEYVGVKVPGELSNLNEWRTRVSARPSASA